MEILLLGPRNLIFYPFLLRKIEKNTKKIEKIRKKIGKNRKTNFFFTFFFKFGLLKNQ